MDREFEQLIEYRAEIRTRARLPGMAGRWHLGKARKILQDPDSQRTRSYVATIEDEKWSEFIG
jgi:hypothetical protein